MNTKLGVDDSESRSWSSLVRFTTWASQIWRVDDGMEIDERVVTGSVLVAERNGCGRSLRGLGQIVSIEHRMSTGRSFAIRIIAHVFHVGAPDFACGIELIRKRITSPRSVAKLPHLIPATIARSTPILRSLALLPTVTSWLERANVSPFQ